MSGEPSGLRNPQVAAPMPAISPGHPRRHEGLLRNPQVSLNLQATRLVSLNPQALSIKSLRNPQVAAPMPAMTGRLIAASSALRPSRCRSCGATSAWQHASTPGRQQDDARGHSPPRGSAPRRPRDALPRHPAAPADPAGPGRGAAPALHARQPGLSGRAGARSLYPRFARAAALLPRDARRRPVPAPWRGGARVTDLRGARRHHPVRGRDAHRPARRLRRAGPAVPAARAGGWADARAADGRAGGARRRRQDGHGDGTDCPPPAARAHRRAHEGTGPSGRRPRRYGPRAAGG